MPTCQHANMPTCQHAPGVRCPPKVLSQRSFAATDGFTFHAHARTTRRFRNLFTTILPEVDYICAAYVREIDKFTSLAVTVIGAFTVLNGVSVVLTSLIVLRSLSSIRRTMQSKLTCCHLALHLPAHTVRQCCSSRLLSACLHVVVRVRRIDAETSKHGCIYAYRIIYIYIYIYIYTYMFLNYMRASAV